MLEISDKKLVPLTSLSIFHCSEVQLNSGLPIFPRKTFLNYEAHAYSYLYYLDWRRSWVKGRKSQNVYTSEWRLSKGRRKFSTSKLTTYILCTDWICDTTYNVFHLRLFKTRKGNVLWGWASRQYKKVWNTGSRDYLKRPVVYFLPDKHLRTAQHCITIFMCHTTEALSLHTFKFIHH